MVKPNSITLSINEDSLDQTIKKATQLKNLLEEINQLIESLSSEKSKEAFVNSPILTKHEISLCQLNNGRKTINQIREEWSLPPINKVGADGHFTKG